MSGLPFAAIAREKAEQRGRLLRALVGTPEPGPEPDVEPGTGAAADRLV